MVNRKQKRQAAKKSKRAELKLVSKVTAAKRPANAHPDTPENLEITVLIPKSFAEAALKEQRLWAMLWGEMVPNQCRQAALELKGLVLNDFKPIQTPEEMAGARVKMLELEKPAPILTAVPKVPDGVEEAENPAELGKLLKANGFTRSNKPA